MKTENVEKTILINPWVWEFIQTHALTFENEIFGWLVGYFSREGFARILLAFDCQKFTEQSYISAIPDQKEFQTIAQLLPPGIGIIGIYHSHPRKSKIFHSHIDDGTIQDYTNLVDNFISIVTNGEDTECYMLTDKTTRQITSVHPQLQIPPLPDGLFIKVPLQIPILIEDFPPKSFQITSYIANLIYEKWEKCEFNNGNVEIPSNIMISEIQAFLKAHNQKRDSDIIQIKNQALNKPIIPSKNTISIQTEIFLYLFNNHHKTLAEIEPIFRTILLDALNQRILKGFFDDKVREWKIGSSLVCHMFQIPLSLKISAQDPKLEIGLFLQRMLRTLIYIPKKTIKSNKNQHSELFGMVEQLEEICKLYNFPDYEKEFLNLKKMIK